MNKWTILNNISVEKLVYWGKWFAKTDEGKTIFITGWAVPGNVVSIRIIKKKKDYLEWQIISVEKKSDFETTPKCDMFWMCWWCKWQTIPYEKQLEIKSNQINEALFHIKKLQNDIPDLTIEPSPLQYWYRNKIEFSFWKYISELEDVNIQFNCWFHRQWQFSKIVDCNYCHLIDEKMNEIFLTIKEYAKGTWLPTYDQKTHEGFFRHLIIRKAHKTNEVMVILSFNPLYESGKVKEIESFLTSLPRIFPEIKSIYISTNSAVADRAIWELHHIHWKKFITEEILWLKFQISPKSFFQTNSLWAEKLYEIVQEFTNEKDMETKTVYDLYAGTGTIWMLFAEKAKNVVSIELVTEASKDGEKNAWINWLKNIEFINAKVEDYLKTKEFSKKEKSIVIIDPPRAWMHIKALKQILNFSSDQIIYVSCNPATLARDLGHIIWNAPYKIENIKWVDMFPHTHHIETVVSLVKNK